jgi:carbon storage regulator CsrA
LSQASIGAMLAELISFSAEGAMLVLSRKKDEQLVIRLGEQTVLVRILAVTRDRVRIGVVADRAVEVHREEVARRIAEWQDGLETALAEKIPHP